MKNILIFGATAGEFVPEEPYAVPLDKASIVKEGSNITVVVYGDGLQAALEALEMVCDVSVELIELVSINPIDEETIRKSLGNTRRLLTKDTTNASFNVGSEILARARRLSIEFLSCPSSLSCTDVPCPTSTALIADYYPIKINIANAINNQLRLNYIQSDLTFEELHLTPRYIF
jgi:pyruvate/2-oxoglutarate/acetoin dehydrogenase E1 component